MKSSGAYAMISYTTLRKRRTISYSTLRKCQMKSSGAYRMISYTTLRKRQQNRSNRLTLSSIERHAIAIGVEHLDCVDNKTLVCSFLDTHHLTAWLEHRRFVVHVLHPHLQ